MRLPWSASFVAGIFFATASWAHAAEPIVIDKGGTYRGDWVSDDPTVPVVRIATREPVIIERSTLRGRGALIVADGGGADLTVRDTRGVGLNPNMADRAAGRFLQADEIRQLTIEHCELDGTAGIYVHRIATANGGKPPTLHVIANVARNIDGRRSDGRDGYRDFNRRTRLSDGRVEEGFDVVQFVQLDGVVGLEHGEIAWNQVINEPGRSRVEDNISIYESSGTREHPLLIHDNCIRGAFTIAPEIGDRFRDGWQEDWSYSGGGIMLGDGPAKTLDTASGHLRAERNVVVATTNYGIAVSSGHDMAILNNELIASGVLPGGGKIDGGKIIAQNVGIYVWDTGKGAKRTPPTFFGNGGSGNTVAWTTAGGKPARNDWWVPDAAAWTGNVHQPGEHTPDDEAAAIDRWRARAAQAGQTIGIRDDKP